jgi:ribosomal protein L24E
MSEFQTSSTRKAQKQHKCQCCYKPIEPGTQYVRHAGCNDGDFYWFVFHENCGALVQKVADYIGEAIDPGEAIYLAEEYGVEL